MTARTLLLLGLLSCGGTTENAQDAYTDGHLRCERTSECEEGRTCYSRRCLTPEEFTAKQEDDAAKAKQHGEAAAKLAAAEAAKREIRPTFTGNKAHDLLAAKRDDERNAMFKAVIKESKYRCDRVTQSFFQGIEQESREAYWNIACRNGRSFAIAIYPDETGSTRVLECDLLKQIGVECFKKFEDLETEAKPKASRRKKALAPVRTSESSRRCCKHCSSGKPCGDSCIAANRTCHKGRGCAC